MKLGASISATTWRHSIPPGPSEVAPYYEADRAAYAAGRTLRVITGYDDDPGSLGRGK